MGDVGDANICQSKWMNKVEAKGKVLTVIWMDGLLETKAQAECQEQQREEEVVPWV